MVTDDDRRQLYVALEATLGRVPAATMMALLPPAGWADLATRADLEGQGLALRGEMVELGAQLKGEMSELRTELKGEMSGLRTELNGEMSGLRTELNGEMSDLRTEMHSLLPKLITANIASMIGVAGLVLAAIGIAR
jgi:hypothetical protein